LAEGVTEEKSAEIAQQWMDIADVDESGTIDKSEFAEFLQKLDKDLEQSKCDELFDAQDGDNSGELNIEAFGKALYEGIKDMKFEEGEANEEEE